jgi:hypothetical protein
VAERTRALTVSAALTALAVVFLYLASVLPTGQLGAAAVSSLFTAAAVIEAGAGWAAGVFAVSCVLGAVIVPNRLPVLLYALFLGHYPIVKCFAERVKLKAARWAVKLAVFNAALAVMWLAFKETLLGAADINLSAVPVFLAGNAVFVLFDIGLTRLIGLYVRRISGRSTASRR